MNLFGLTHVYNEEFLMPGFVKHHRELFDQVTVVDHHSTDNTLAIIRELAPEWKIVTSHLPEFDAELVDVEMQEQESLLPEGYKLILNATEWVWSHDFRQQLEQLDKDNPDIKAFGIRSFCLVDNILDQPILDPLFKNHTWGLEDRYFGVNVPRHHRFVHKGQRGLYSTGRHHSDLPRMLGEDLFLIHWTFAPWPQAVQRKMQIQDRMPWTDKVAGKGIQHLQTLESLNITYNNWLKESKDLMQDERFRKSYEVHVAR